MAERTAARDARGSIASKSLTPLLDTLFILLFALLALSRSSTSHAAEVVRVKLPEVEPSGLAPGQAVMTLAIEVGADSVIRLGWTGEEIRDRADLDRALSEALGEALPEEVLVQLKADRDTPHGLAVELLQHLRLVGFSNVELLAVGARSETDVFGTR